MRSPISRTVWILSLVSLFTDTASEMLYPVMPIYLKTIGFSIVLIGILEGVAEATAGFTKGYFGKLSDNTARRLPFVKVGYTLSALSKPMMAMLIHPLWIFFARTVDRLGKGVRTGARDAMLSDEATPSTKGKIFGFHRSMDTLGAVLGPSFALLYLYLYPASYRVLFFIAFIPGLLAICASYLLKEHRTIQNTSSRSPTSFFAFVRYWNESTHSYRKLVTGLLAFTLFNSSDVFLLLKARESGLSDTGVIGVYIFYNLVFALSAYPAGIIADKLGLRRTFISGICIFALVYLGVSVAQSIYSFAAIFFLYGIYAASTEGISKAWITNVCERKDTATAIGTYTAFQSILTMVASAMAGIVWYQFGASATFIITGIAAIGIVIYFMIAT
jgi:MFS family permease